MRFDKITIFVLTIIFSCLSCSLKAQDSSVSNLFEYGMPIVSSEDNFKNLMKNIPLYIDNGYIVDILNYKFIGIIKDKKQAKHYVKKNLNKKMPIFAPSFQYESSSDNFEKSVVKFLIDKNINFYDFKEFVNTISQDYVHKGYEIYMLTFVFELKTYDYYIFINPETKRVVKLGNLFGFDIPEKHFKLCDDIMNFNKNL